jgi:hypothetical protein
VDYRLFLHKLVSSFDFHGSARDMVFTFLNGRSMVVGVDGTRSSPRALFSGVPNRLSERMHHSKFQFYANDLQIYLLGIVLTWMA